MNLLGLKIMTLVLWASNRNVTKAENPTCPQSWVQEKDKCYHAFNDSVTWQGAVDTCIQSNAVLVNLNDLTEQTFILQLRPLNSNQSHWIGFYRNDSTWTWTDSDTVGIDILERKNISEGEDCAAITKKGVWAPTNCADKLPFFCEMDPVVCPMFDGWTFYNGMCYLALRTVYTWAGARDVCHTHGADLAIANNIYTTGTFLRQFNITDKLWIGFRLDNVTLSFVWLDGSPVEGVAGSSLGPCGFMRQNVTTGKVDLVGDVCANPGRAMCELSQTNGLEAGISTQSSTAVMSTSTWESDFESAATDCAKLQTESERKRCVQTILADEDMLCDTMEQETNYHMLVDKVGVITVLQSLLGLAGHFLQPNLTFSMCSQSSQLGLAVIESAMDSILERSNTNQPIHIAREYIEMVFQEWHLTEHAHPHFESIITGCNVYNLTGFTITHDTTTLFMVITNAFYLEVDVDNSFSDPDMPHYIVSPVLVISVYSNSLKISVSHTFTMFYSSMQDFIGKDLWKRTETELSCAFFIPISRKWSRTGCHVLSTDVNTVTCQCSHTTSFAVLMKVHTFELPKEHTLALSVITILGCSVSIVTIFIALTVFTCIRSLHSERVFVHRNLCLAILSAQVLFMAGIRATSYKTVCRVVALFLHYSFMSVFTWMLVEGLQLYTKVVQVFSTERSRNTYNLIFGWGIPLLLVGISAAADWEGYGTSKSCWLSMSRRTIWAFVGPAIAVMLVNVIILAMVLKIVVNTSRTEPPSNLKQTKAAVKAALFLLPLLGLTWIFGLLVVNKDFVVFEYMFALCNSLQGFFVFLFHCVLNTEVRQSLRRLRERRALLNEGTNTSTTGPSVSDTDTALARVAQVAGIVHLREGTLNVRIRYKNDVRLHRVHHTGTRHTDKGVVLLKCGDPDEKKKITDDNISTEGVSMTPSSSLVPTATDLVKDPEDMTVMYI